MIVTVNKNHHTFKGHKTLLGAKYITYGELELPLRYDIFAIYNGFDWGNRSLGAQQLAFSMLYQVTNEEFARDNISKFTQDFVSKFNGRDWVVTGFDVLKWVDDNREKTYVLEEETSKSKEEMIADEELILKPKALKKEKKIKSNIVKDACSELGITQKELANILQIPEGTISSWAVKNEIPRLGKKAIEFYTQNQKNQKIIENYKNFVKLLDN
jgi:DNA-binding transcriptional regulator YiaG